MAVTRSMKRILTFGLALLPALFTAKAQDTNRVFRFLDAASQAKSLTLAVAPAYAPDIVTGNGDKAPWGLCLATAYPVVDMGFVRGLTGLRLDWLADQLWLPTLDVTFQSTVRLFEKIDVTPFVLGGAIFPFDQGNSSGESVGAIVGGGAGVTVKSWTWGNLSVGGAVERWTPFPGPIYRVGGALTVNF